jgi:hypothetical protein
MIELGDYVEQKHPVNECYLKRGIVIQCKNDCFVVQWLSYNKNFFMEFKGEAFEELNRRYLLTKMSYARTNDRADIVILSKAGGNGVG